MGGRMRVLVAVWVAAFGVEAIRILARCLGDVGPVGALQVVMADVVSLAAAATLITFLVGVFWIAWASEGPSDDPGAEPSSTGGGS